MAGGMWQVVRIAQFPFRPTVYHNGDHLYSKQLAALRLPPSPFPFPSVPIGLRGSARIRRTSAYTRAAGFQREFLATRPERGEGLGVSGERRGGEGVRRGHRRQFAIFNLQSFFSTIH